MNSVLTEPLINEPNRVPTLDLARYGHDCDALVEEVGAAYRRWGFCGFVNHGIGDDLVEDAYRAFRRLFALPNEAKRKYSDGRGGQRGYTGFGVEQAKDHAVPDLKEFWHLGRELAGKNPWPEILRPNVWPREVPEFRQAALHLYQALDRLSLRVLRAIALALGLAERWFDDKVNVGNCVLRAIHYPPIRDRETPAVRAAQHEDINLITLLPGSNEEGLQILARDGRWVPVTTIPGTMVVNIGDMMQRLTNHVLPSTPHRVVNPPGMKAERSRYSIPFFVHPNPDFVIETLPQCISEDRPNRYPEPIDSHEFLLQRLREIKLL